MVLKRSMNQKSIKTNTIYNAIKTLSTVLFPLITFPYILRVLHPENIGKIFFGLSIVSYFSLISSLGIYVYAIRECSVVRDNKEKLSNIASQIWSINIIMTVVSYLFLVITLFVYSKLENYKILIVIQSLSILFTTLGTDWLNQAMEDLRYITIRTVVFQFISLLLIFVFVHNPEDYIKYAVICLVSSSGASIVNIWYCRRRYCRIKFIKNTNWKKHLTPIMYMFVMLLAQTVFNSVDSTMLGLMHGAREVGIYSSANKMSTLVTQLVASLLWVILPRMSYYFAIGDYDKINELLRKVLGFNALVGLPLVAGTFVMSDEIVYVIAGNEYADAGCVLKILMIGFLFTLFGGSFWGNSVLLPSGREKIFMIICCIAAVVNVITNYIFIPLYGAIAAAGTTAFSALVILVTLLFTVDRNIKITRKSKLIITPVAGCVGICVVCMLCKLIDSLWTRTIISIVGSSVAYVIISYFGKNELFLELMDSLKNKILRR